MARISRRSFIASLAITVAALKGFSSQAAAPAPPAFTASCWTQDAHGDHVRIISSADTAQNAWDGLNRIIYRLKPYEFGVHMRELLAKI